MLRACKRLSIVLNFGICSTFTYLLNLVSTFLFFCFFFVVKLEANSKSWNMSGFACLWYGASNFLTDFAMFCSLWKVIFNNSYLVVVDASVFSSPFFLRRLCDANEPQNYFSICIWAPVRLQHFNRDGAKTVYINIYICLDLGPLADLLYEKETISLLQVNGSFATCYICYTCRNCNCLDYVLQSALIWAFCASTAICTTPITTRT